MTRHENDQLLILLAGIENPFSATPHFGNLGSVSQKIYENAGVLPQRERNQRREPRVLEYLKAKFVNRS